MHMYVYIYTFSINVFGVFLSACTPHTAACASCVPTWPLASHTWPTATKMSPTSPSA